jgi:hypothetical protein
VRLSPGLRIGLYAAFAVLFTSGAGWLAANWLKDGSGDDMWQESAAYLLMLHGGCTMAILMLLGALAPLHVQRHGAVAGTEPRERPWSPSMRC